MLYLEIKVGADKILHVGIWVEIGCYFRMKPQNCLKEALYEGEILGWKFSGKKKDKYKKKY